jgi:protein-L-isoaspartate(D-aspartate) O-methyltransferase
MSRFMLPRRHLLAGILAAVSPAACKDGAPPDAAAFEQQRERMVREQIAAKGRDIKSERVLRAMRVVPRHEFVPENVRAHAYADTALPIGHDQTISQPYVVAFMTAALDPQPGERVLEIGTGSGYQAAVLAALGVEVYTIEIVKPLGEQARQVLRKLGYDRIKVRIGDGYAGWPDAAPFDAIIVTCAPEKVPQPLIDQLKPGGRMIIPVGDQQTQELYLLKKEAAGLSKTAVLPVRFVPMTGAAEKEKP